MTGPSSSSSGWGEAERGPLAGSRSREPPRRGGVASSRLLAPAPLPGPEPGHRVGAGTHAGDGAPPPRLGAAARGHCGATFPSPSAGAPAHHFPRPASSSALHRLPPLGSVTPPSASFDRRAGGRPVPAPGVGSGVLVRPARPPRHLPDLQPLHPHARPCPPAPSGQPLALVLGLVRSAERRRHRQPRCPRTLCGSSCFPFLRGLSPCHYHGTYTCRLREVFGVAAGLTSRRSSVSGAPVFTGSEPLG